MVASATFDYPMFTPRPLWAEQNPEDWWTATVSAIRKVIADSGAEASQIAGVGLTGQMHGLVLLDTQGHVLRPCIMWNDQRTGPQCAAITERIGAERILELIANPVLPGFTAPKIVWVRENEPEVYAQVAQALLPEGLHTIPPHGAIRHRGVRRFGHGPAGRAQPAVALGDAGRPGYPHLVDAPRLELIVPSTSISAEAAELTGLKAGTPVVGGAGLTRRRRPWGAASSSRASSR